jgi:hypothetical protein
MLVLSKLSFVLYYLIIIFYLAAFFLKKKPPLNLEGSTPKKKHKKAIYLSNYPKMTPFRTHQTAHQPIHPSRSSSPLGIIDSHETLCLSH